MNALEDIIYPAVDEAKQSVPSAAGLARSPDAILFGDGGLASLDLVRFIVMVEERIEDESGAQNTLASDQALSRRNSPFKNLQTLADYIEECLAEEASQ